MTALSIEVAPLPDSQDSDISAVGFSHKGCSHPSITRHRNVVTDVYTLSCPCGLEISFSQNGPAATKILCVANGGLPTLLDTGTFSSNTENAPVYIVPPASQNLPFSCRGIELSALSS